MGFVITTDDPVVAPSLSAAPDAGRGGGAPDASPSAGSSLLFVWVVASLVGQIPVIWLGAVIQGGGEGTSTSTSSM